MKAWTSAYSCFSVSPARASSRVVLANYSTASRLEAAESLRLGGEDLEENEVRRYD
jgi:hypothetical protein